MARSTRTAKKLIYVFCEGESEQCYTRFLKSHFSEVAVIQPPIKGLFSDAQNKFEKDHSFRDAIEVIDEIWFFFDVETSDKDKWERNFKIIKKLCNLRKKPKIKVRLLMTTACVEYWFMLHYQNIAPHFSTLADKENMLHKLQQEVPTYQKGDQNSTNEIASHYSTAIKNSSLIFNKLSDEGMPTREDSIERNMWLLRSDCTFSTVQEALLFLESLPQT